MKSFFREPVFVDPTGRRSRTLRRVGVLVVAPTSAYLVLMVSSVLGGPALDTPLLPLAPAAGAPVTEPEVARIPVDGPTIRAVRPEPRPTPTARPAAKQPDGSTAAAAPKGQDKVTAPKQTSGTAEKAQAPARRESQQPATTPPKAPKPSSAPASPKPIAPAAPPSQPPAVPAEPVKPAAPAAPAGPLAPVVAVVPALLDPVVDLLEGIGGLLGSRK